MTTKEVGFTLDRFQWTHPGRLHVEGAWTAMDDRSVSDPVLVVRTKEGRTPLDALPGALTSAQRWSAIFAWDQGADVVESAELHVGPDAIVELPAPAPDSGRRRFARERLSVRRREQEAEPDRESDAVATYAALLAAREDAARWEEEARAALADARTAREDAERERGRRRSEAQRSRDALETFRQVAEVAAQEARTATKQLSAEVDQLRAMLADARDEIAGLREQLSTAARAEQLLEDAGAEIERLGAELARMRGAAEEAALLRDELGRARAEADRAGSEAQRLALQIDAIRRALADGA